MMDGAGGREMAIEAPIHSAAGPLPNVTSAAEAASRRACYGRAEARPSICGISRTKMDGTPTARNYSQMLVMRQPQDVIVHNDREY
jgi:hypothetical protein